MSKSKAYPITALGMSPTKWESAEQKAKWASHLVRFLEARCPEATFQDWFYQRLSNTFGHIAHYNRAGFYDTWFRTANDRFRFVKHLLDHQVFGDPAWTYCDAEAAVQDHIIRFRSALVAKLHQEARDEQQAQDEHLAEAALKALPPDARRKVATIALLGL
jgi:hypothetical protein